MKQLLAATRPTIPANFAVSNPAHGKGIPASNGCVSGVAVFSSADAIKSEKPCILVSEETTPDDIGGMNAAVGILTSTGGATSHAAVVARGMDKVCVVGCTDLKKGKNNTWLLAENGKAIQIIKPGTKLTLNGNTGEIWVGGNVPISGGEDNVAVAELLSLISNEFDTYRTCVRVDEFYGAKKVLFATYLFDREYVGPVLKEQMKHAFKSMGDAEVIIDMRCMGDVVREEAAPLEFLFGNPNEQWGAGIKVNALLNTQINKDKVSVLACGLSEGEMHSLTVAGIKVVPVVDNVSALIRANGIVMADQAKLASSMEESDLLRLLELKNRRGEAAVLQYRARGGRC
jgi:phosphohistidine swiveling domain-containing protein